MSKLENSIKKDKDRELTEILIEAIDLEQDIDLKDLFDLDKEIDKLNSEREEKGKDKEKNKEKNKGKNKGKKDDKSKGKAPTFDNTNESQIRDSQSSLNGN